MRVGRLAAVVAVAVIGLVVARACAADPAPNTGRAPRSVDTPEARPRAERTPLDTNVATERVRAADDEGAPVPREAVATVVVRTVTRDGVPVTGAAVDLHRVRNRPEGYDAPECTP